MEITFQSHPDVVIAGTIFRNVKTIIQYRDIPILEVGQYVPAGFTIRFPVFHKDGTKIAVVKGSQIYLTEEGKKAVLVPRYEPNLTAFELEGKTILELRRDKATALHAWAELYAPEGVLIKAIDSGATAILRSGGGIPLGEGSIHGGIFDGCDIAIHVTDEGVWIGGGGGKISRGVFTGPIRIGRPPPPLGWTLDVGGPQSPHPGDDQPT